MLAWLSSKSKMVALLLVAISTLLLLPSAGALSTAEKDQFTARIHEEQNTKLQGEVTLSDENRKGYFWLDSNGIPDHDTGKFPADGRGNPNEIVKQNHSSKLPMNPTFAGNPTCLPMGIIAYAKNGVGIFNALNSDGEDAVNGTDRERFDECNGHPNKQGVYHYHQIPNCLSEGTEDELIGVALDGFPIYGSKDCNGRTITSADLDECHGRWEGDQYRYRITSDYPYVMACFKGKPTANTSGGNCKFLSVTSTKNVTMTTDCTRELRKIDELYNYLRSYRG